MSEKQWYVVVDRCELVGLAPLPPYAVGPFATEAEAEEECQEGLLTESLCTVDAKAERYIVDDAYYTDLLPEDADLINPESIEWLVIGE